MLSDNQREKLLELEIHIELHADVVIYASLRACVFLDSINLVNALLVGSELDRLGFAFLLLDRP
jgi:hypothetical protein